MSYGCRQYQFLNFQFCPSPFRKQHGPMARSLARCSLLHNAGGTKDLCCIPPSLQSGFRPGHSTAVLRVLSDILQAVDSEDVAALVLLDLFHTVDHAILCWRLRLSIGLDGSAPVWFRSYLHWCSQYARRGVLRSSSVQLICGVPQSSVLGPILFIMYRPIADLVLLIDKHGFCPRHTLTTRKFTAPPDIRP